jgi:hypothetical protein
MNTKMLEHLLLYSTLSKLKISKKRYRNIYRPLTNFGLELDSRTDEKFGTGANCENFFLIVRPNDLTGDLNDALIATNEDVASHYDSFFISHAYRVPLKQIRGLPFNSYPIAMTHYQIQPQKEEARVNTMLLYYAPKGNVAYHDLSWANNWTLIRRWNAGTYAERDWIVEGPMFGKFPQGETDLELNSKVQCHLGHQFSIRYDWYVLIGFEDLPKLKMSIDPKRARSLFEIKKIKDPIEGRKRLIHWVSEHQRKKPKSKQEQEQEREQNQEDWIHVCEHLRGYYEFEWHGLNCWLIPSEYDREKLQPHLKHSEIWA